MEPVPEWSPIDSLMLHGDGGGGIKQALGIMCIYIESLWRFQSSIQVCRGFDGDQCLECFCSKGRTSLHCQKVDMG